MARKNKKIVRKVVKLNVILTMIVFLFYVALGYSSGWDILIHDIDKKSKMAGAGVSNVATFVRVYGPVNVPTLVATPACNSQNISHISLSWALDENATQYNIYRDGLVLMLGITGSSFDDLSVTDNQTYLYNIVAEGPQGTATSNSVTVLADACSSEVPNVFIRTFQGEIINNPSDSLETKERTIAIQGQTNILNAIIEIEIFGEETIYASTNANNTGYWQWTSPSRLSYGTYVLRVNAVDISDNSINASSVLSFRVVEKDEDDKDEEDEDEDEDKEKYYENIENYSTTGYSLSGEELKEKHSPERSKSFDFEVGMEEGIYVKGVNMKDEFYRGEDLELSILFSEGAIQNKKANTHYTLYTLDQKMVAEYDDEVYISAGEELTKKIHLPYKMELGEYKLQVSVTIEDVTVSHENYFILKDRLAIKLGGGSITYVELVNNVGWSLLICLLLLLLIFVIATIWEHRLTQKAIYHITGKFLKNKGFVR